MITEYDTLAAYFADCEADPSLRGPSPGGAAASLGITRQGVYSAVKRGSLDLIRVLENGHLSLYITNGSIARYIPFQGKPGRRPSLKQQLTVSVDKRIRGVW